MEKIKERASQKREDAGARKSRKVTVPYVFPMIWGSGGSKSNLAKAAGAEPAGQMRDEKVHAAVARTHFQVKSVKNPRSQTTFGSWDVEKIHAVVAEAHFQVKMHKTHHARTTLGSWDVEKVHAVVAEAHFQVKMHKTHHARTTLGSWDVLKVHAVVVRSTFPSQNAQNTPCSDHFWKLRCRKSARRWWREAHFQVKSVKNPWSQTTFGSWDVEKTHAVVARSTFPSQKCQKPTVSDYFWKLRCREAHFQVKMHKTHHARTTFGSWDVERVHAVVTRSTFPSRNCKTTTCSDHFLTSRCRKSVRRCGAKHISKSKVQKTVGFEPFLTFRCGKSGRWLH